MTSIGWRQVAAERWESRAELDLKGGFGTSTSMYIHLQFTHRNAHTWGGDIEGEFEYIYFIP